MSLDCGYAGANSASLASGLAPDYSTRDQLRGGLLTARLAENAPGPDGNLSLIIHGPRKPPLPEQQHDAAQESPEPAPAPESQDAGAPFPSGCRPIW